MLIWKCERCGWQSGKSGAEGSGEALTHAKIGKREGLKHSCFLFDTDAQKPVLDADGNVIKSLAKAQSLGLISKQEKAGKHTKGKPLGQREGGKFATVAAIQPAPVVFFLGEHRIELEPEAIYESYLLYQDIKLRCGINEGFSDTLRDGMGLLWRILAGEPVMKKGK